jgi:acyl-CoA synthetase (AMP-forming)/AMP-acid ligase II
MRLHDYLEFHARTRPEAEFAASHGRTVTYGEALAEVHRTANALVAAGLRPGDRAAFLSKNSVEHALIYFAASEAGVVLVPLNYRLASREWAYIVADAGARVLIATPAYTADVDAVRPELGTVGRFFVVGDASGAWSDFRAAVGEQPARAPAVRVRDGDDAIQMYTSGTTGRPKGAVLGHDALSAAVHQYGIGLPGFAPGDRTLVVAPLYHMGAAMSAFCSAAYGGTLVIHEDFDPAAVVRSLDEDRIVGAMLVPAMIQACLVAVPDVSTRPFDALKAITYGASPIAESTLRQAAAAFKCDFYQAYGMTETSGGATLLDADDHRRALAGERELLVSAGRPLPGTALRVVDEDDRDLPVGQVGEIVVRGPQLMRGYWNLADETAEALRGGWLHTGDAGRVDADGYLYILDRVKDMIVSGGENVYPREVEDVLFEHPAVADVAVIGVPDAQWGEAVKAIVVRRAGAEVGEGELMEFCRGRLGGFKRPRSVDFVDALPRNATGKVLKRQLREPYWAGQVRRVAGA